MTTANNLCGVCDICEVFGVFLACVVHAVCVVCVVCVVQLITVTELRRTDKYGVSLKLQLHRDLVAATRALTLM